VSLCKRESYGFVGPVNLSLLPSYITELFIDSYDLRSDFKFTPHSILNIQSCLHKEQVPKVFWPFMNEIGNKWTCEHIEVGIKGLTKNVDDITPRHYPFAGKMLKQAIESLDLNKNVKILIAGSISPWVECLCLNYGFSNITTSDYQTKLVEDKRIKFVHSNEILNYKFDLIVSFSSIEHDGLGRYGDPINPYGAFNTVNEFYNTLNANGKLICGLPVYPNPTQTSRIQGNNHIIFSQKSINKLFRQFQILNVISMPTEETLPTWQNQPIFILNKKT